MPRFCANLTMLYGEHDFLDRFAAAASGRLRGRRVPVPLRLPEGGAWPRRCSATVWSRCCTTCRPATGTRASAASPAARAARASSRTASAGRSSTPPRWAASRSTAWPASRPRVRDRSESRRTLVENLRFAAPELDEGRDPAAARAGQHPRHPGLLPEPRRPGRGDHRGGRLGQPLPPVRFLPSRRCMEGELVPTFQRLKDRIAHVQIADNPGPQRAGHGRDQLPVPLRARSTGRATPAGSAASTSPAAETSDGLGLVRAAIAAAA